jgi:translation elongation factor EF-1beta
MDEKLGGTDPLEAKLSEIEGVNSVEVIDVRRAIG